MSHPSHTLNCIEIIWHFADPILESFYILDPQWACAGPHEVLEKAKKESVNGRTIISSMYIKYSIHYFM